MTNTSDLIIRIKNAARARRRQVRFPYSKVSKIVLLLLKKEGFLEDVKEEGEKDLPLGRKELTANIRYEDRIPVITDCEIISKPSLRVYSSNKKMAGLKNRLGITVISTSNGIMTQKEAQKKGTGGELLFRVW